MKIGTKSLLFGVHTFWIHPFVVAYAWWRMYGWKPVGAGRYSLRDPRLWVAFTVHDWGYWGSPNMDGEEGERHPLLGASLMFRWFDRGWWERRPHLWSHLIHDIGHAGHPPSPESIGLDLPRRMLRGYRWYDLCLGHSRYFAKRAGIDVSPLCFADKMSITMEPFYLLRARLTGELKEYMGYAATWIRREPLSREEREQVLSPDSREWYDGLCTAMRRWVREHSNGESDSWTGVRHVEAHNGERTGEI